MKNFANLDKLRRATEVVQNTVRYSPESVEVKALAIVNQTSGLSEEEKIEQVYLVLGGKILSEKEVEVLEEVKKSHKSRKKAE